MKWLRRLFGSEQNESAVKTEALTATSQQEEGAIPDSGLYGSGLNSEDWYTFLNILLPFLSNQELATIEIPKVKNQLSHHPFMEAISAYKDSGNREFLDKAGKCLIPTDEPFGWWLAVTKS